MRIALAKLLLARPNLLLMDEPTNHLDLPARNWLEEYLSDYPGSVVLVSHDRFFLDSTVKRITEVGLRTLTDYHGNYSKYVVEHQAPHGAPARGAPPAERRRSRRPRPSSTSFRYQATKARQVQSRIKLLDKVERIEIPAAAQEDPLQVSRRAQGGPRGDRAQGRDRKATATTWCSTASTCSSSAATASPSWARTAPASRRSCASSPAWIAPTRARASLGHQVVHRLLRPGPGGGAQPDAHGLRGDVVGQPDDHGADDPQHPRRVPVLRATTCTRSAACSPVASATASRWPRCCCTPSNLLLLDEPTNHLDLDSKEVLLDALADYGGTLVFVSHDRYFVDKPRDQGDRGRRRRGACSTPAATRTSWTGRSSVRPAWLAACQARTVTRRRRSGPEPRPRRASRRRPPSLVTANRAARGCKARARATDSRRPRRSRRLRSARPAAAGRRRPRNAKLCRS